ncbi:MAG: PTS sugar transporter subunit IIA [Lachnospiraceae bacterium]|nr:PTS sugar transporter subunit IIA [Lachnospiraceae bacterium]
MLPSYYHVHQNLYQYYCDSFRHTVLAEHVTALSACDHLDSVDVVVSTQDLTGLNGKRFVKISPIRTQSDLRQLQTLINELHHAKMIGNLQRLLKDMVPESRLTRCPAGVTDMESALDALIRPLLSRGIVSDDFKDAVLRREAFASTTWGQIVLPRVPEYAAAEDAISILLFDTPVSWGDVSVRAIILFTSRDGHYNTHCLRILRRLIHVLRKKGGQNKFFNCQAYEDFCNLLT